MLPISPLFLKSSKWGGQETFLFQLPALVLVLVGGGRDVKSFHETNENGSAHTGTVHTCSVAGTLSDGDSSVSLIA